MTFKIGKPSFNINIREAAVWTFVEMFAINIASILTTVYLARNLLPEDFGMLAPIYVLNVLISGLVDGGMGGAIIRFQDLTQKAFSSIFWLVTLFGLLGALVFILSANPISKYYNEPELELISWVFSFNIFIGSFASVPKALLIKRFMNKIIFRISLISTFASSAVAIQMASAGFGTWAIVAQISVLGIVQTVGFIFAAGWTPSPIFSFFEIRKCFSFGYMYTVIGYINGLYRYAASALLGKYLDLSAAGIYAQSDRVQQMLSDQFISITQRLAFPIFSAIHHSNSELQAAYIRGYQLLVAVLCPTMIGLASVAECLLPTLFGEQWRPGIPILQVLCIAGFIAPLEVYDQMAIKAIGLPGVFFRIESIKRLVSLVALVVAVHYGLFMTALVFSIVSIFGFALNEMYIDNLLKTNWVLRLFSPWKTYLSSGIMAAMVLQLGAYLPSSLTLIVLQILTGVLIYFIMNIVLKNKMLLDAFLLSKSPSNP